jgi:hypothetical protein
LFKETTHKHAFQHTNKNHRQDPHQSSPSTKKTNHRLKNTEKSRGLSNITSGNPLYLTYLDGPRTDAEKAFEKTSRKGGIKNNGSNADIFNIRLYNPSAIE